ncbi:hypothetical protein C8R46DRAFT_1052477 [Mycena filopes]|nr:hypothetical protein C8R46DRAFT_1052477 [Mycena filopes]
MSTLIEVLETQLNVDVDDMDPRVSKSLPFVPHNMTSNQYLVNEHIQAPENRAMVIAAVKEYGHDGWEAVFDRISALLCAGNIGNIQGRVLLQTSAFHAYDTQKVVDHARRYAVELEKVGISKDRFCIKIPATGPALNAGAILLKEGIRTLGTSLFSVPQAIAASQAGCLYISPYYNEIAAHADLTLWPNSDDPALEHPMSACLIQILETYKRLYKETGREQPMIKPASFISVHEIMACGEMQMHHATLPARLLAELSTLPAVPSKAVRIPGVPKVDMARPYADTRPTPARFADLARAANWDLTKVDYLADNGAALDSAIEADVDTARRLFDALELFKAAELSSKIVIERAIKEYSEV